MAIDRYRETQGAAPPASVYDSNGTPLHSWRVLILPYLESNRFYSRYEMKEAWNGPSNVLLKSKVVEDTSHGPYELTQVARAYRCGKSNQEKDQFTTNYLMVVDSTAPLQLYQGLSNRRLGWQIQAAAGEELLIVEVAGSDIHWMEPRDFDLEYAGSNSAESHPSLGDLRITGAVAISRSGSFELLGEQAAEQRLRQLTDAHR